LAKNVAVTPPAGAGSRSVAVRTTREPSSGRSLLAASVSGGGPAAFAGIVSVSSGAASVQGPITVTKIVSSSSASASATITTCPTANVAPSRITMSAVRSPELSARAGSSLKSPFCDAVPPGVQNDTTIPPAGAGFDSLAVRTAVWPSAGRRGVACSVTFSAPGSAIVTSTDDGLPAVTEVGRLPSATVNVSSFGSVSWFV